MQIFFLTAAFLSFLLPSPARAELKNILRPFTTDGCTGFPNGVPGVADRLWLHCCVLHDVAYWQGGAREERRLADDELYQCVLKASRSKEVADLVWGGVRLGGHPDLPTASGWGKGWTLLRGYRPLHAEELSQVRSLYPVIPDDVARIPLEKRPLIRPRYFLTGSHCLDLAVLEIHSVLGRGFELAEKVKERWEPVDDGIRLSLAVRPVGCQEPFRFELLLSHGKACTEKMDELEAQRAIKLLEWSRPKSGCAAAPASLLTKR